MKHWWVPGLQIGYEHTFIHQVADFSLPWTEAPPLPLHSAMAWLRTWLPMRSCVLQNLNSGKQYRLLEDEPQGGIMAFDFRSSALARPRVSATFAVVVAACAGCLCAATVHAHLKSAASPVQPIFQFVHPEPINFDDHDGWTQIFDGTSLKDWDGDADVWHVEDGALVGVSSPEHPSGTTNIIWRGAEPGNFELKLEMKLEGTGANGGVQYRSYHVEPKKPRPIPELTPDQRQHRQRQLDLDAKHAPWNLAGYQADFDFKNEYTGQLYEQSSPRGIIAWRGQVVATESGRKPTLLATLGSSDELKALIKPGEWNQVEIIADGNTLVHIINGHIMAVLVDTDPKFSRDHGVIALEIEGPGNVKISHRNIWLKKLP